MVLFCRYTARVSEGRLLDIISNLMRLNMSQCH